jgi:hypothetical protein
MRNVFTEVLYSNENIVTEIEPRNSMSDAIANIFNRKMNVSGNERIESIFER